MGVDRFPDVVAFSWDSESLRETALSNDVFELDRFTFTVFMEETLESNVVDADSSSVGSVQDVFPVT